MRDLKYYENQQREILRFQIIEDLKKGKITLPSGEIIAEEKDLEKKSIQFAIRRVWRTKGRIDFEASKKYQLRMMQPKDGQKLNGMPLEDKIVLPAYAPETHEDSEVTPNMIAIGLYMMCLTAFDLYFYNLLMSFNLDFMPEGARDIIGGWKLDSKKEDK